MALWRLADRLADPALVVLAQVGERGDLALSASREGRLTNATSRNLGSPLHEDEAPVQQLPGKVCGVSSKGAEMTHR